jgi:hypothetical protein
MRIRFVTTNEPISRLIRRGEQGFWATHCEAVMPDGKYLGALIHGGVLARDPDYDASIWTQQLFVDLPATPKQDDAFHDFLRSQIGKPYDLAVICALALSPIIGERDWRQDDHWICSEIITAAEETCLWCPPLATNVGFVTPRDNLIATSMRVAIGVPERNPTVKTVMDKSSLNF